MNYCIIRKVPYRLGKGRLVWAMILAEREGLTLLYVPKPDSQRSHLLVVATENVTERVFEDVNPASRFPLEQEDLFGIANRLHAVGEGISDADFRRMFEPEDLF